MAFGSSSYGTSIYGGGAQPSGPLVASGEAILVSDSWVEAVGRKLVSRQGRFVSLVTASAVSGAKTATSPKQSQLVTLDLASLLGGGGRSGLATSIPGPGIILQSGRTFESMATFEGILTATAVGKKKSSKFSRFHSVPYALGTGTTLRWGAGTSVVRPGTNLAGLKRSQGALDKVILPVSDLQGFKTGLGASEFVFIVAPHGQIFSGLPYPVLVRISIFEDRIEIHNFEDQIHTSVLEDLVQVVSIDAMTGKV